MFKVRHYQLGVSIHPGHNQESTKCLVYVKLRKLVLFCDITAKIGPEHDNLFEPITTLGLGKQLPNASTGRWSYWAAVPTRVHCHQAPKICMDSSTQLVSRPRSCRQAWSRFYSVTSMTDGRGCHSLIPYLQCQDLPGPPQFLEGCAQQGRDTPSWSLFSAKSRLFFSIEFNSQVKHRKTTIQQLDTNYFKE